MRKQRRKGPDLIIYVNSTFTVSSVTYQGRGGWRRDRGRRKKDEDIVSGRRSVSPILVQTCCDELSREPPFSCQQAKAASTAQSQAVGCCFFAPKYICPKAGRADKRCLCTNIPTAVSAINSANMNSVIHLNV